MWKVLRSPILSKLTRKIVFFSICTVHPGGTIAVSKQHVDKSVSAKQPQSTKELAGLTRPIGMLIESELSIFSTTDDVFSLDTCSI